MSPTRGHRETDSPWVDAIEDVAAMRAYFWIAVGCVGLAAALLLRPHLPSWAYYFIPNLFGTMVLVYGGAVAIHWLRIVRARSGSGATEHDNR